jgi:acyl-CoA dehydrogenase
MDFTIPSHIQEYLAVLDAFIISDIKPLEDADDNIRFFDHRREWARTDFDNQGLPRKDWEALLSKARKSADAAGHYWRPRRVKSCHGRDPRAFGQKGSWFAQ